jgi:tetratricopeptide (TPR) repeat protein
LVEHVAPTGSPSISRRQVLERYKHVRDDHLRYMQKWGLIRAVPGGHGESAYAFSDLHLIRDADALLAEGASFRAVLRTLLASRSGQLTFDFRIEAPRAKVLQLTQREPPPMTALLSPVGPPPPSAAEEYFTAASTLDDGDPANADKALLMYRRALEIDPYLVPAMINLANLHYGRDAIAEAQALYERAVALEADVFEAHFNLGNIFHDLGRYQEAQTRYREALRLNPAFADAHFYLAVTLEKAGQSPEARRHWRAYQQLAPQGEWVGLAREFSEGPPEA